jgi:hypothetical protein
MSQPVEPRPPKKPYEPPLVEDVPIAPEEQMLAPCKASGQVSPLCAPNVCDDCMGPGS